jgi:hypothetical protein
LQYSKQEPSLSIATAKSGPGSVYPQSFVISEAVQLGAADVAVLDTSEVFVASARAAGTSNRVVEAHKE